MLLQSQSQEVGKQRELSVRTASSDGGDIISVAALVKGKKMGAIRYSLRNHTGAFTLGDMSAAYINQRDARSRTLI